MPEEGTPAERLVGAWRLVSHFYLADDGSTHVGPCGDNAEGLLIYERHGYMSAALMRVDKPTANDPATAVGYMGYSGRWRVESDRVVHEVVVSSHPRIVNTEKIKEARLDRDRLLVRERLEGPPQYIVMEWRRADPSPTEKRAMQTNGIDAPGGVL